MSQMRYDYYTIISHTTEPRMLLLSGKNGWSLPHFVTTDAHHRGAGGYINQMMRNQLGIDVTVLRCVHDDYKTEARRVYIYALENHSPTWEPPANGRWFGRDELDNLTLTAPEHRSALESWFAEVEGDNIPEILPWQRTGWFDETTAWIHAQLNRLGFTAVGLIEQFRTWELSCILRVTTTVGDLYFKAVPSAREPLLTQALAEQYPIHIPTILAVDTEWHWMLMRDMGGKLLYEVSDTARWEEALRIYAQIQLDLVERVDDLIALGCPERRLDRLSEQIEPLFADTHAMMPGEPEDLSASEIEELRVLTPQFKAMCAELANYGMPYTLEHGDLWPGNIIVTDENCIYFDWADSSIAHPFFSLLPFFELGDSLPDIPDIRARLRNAYLEPWTIYEPMPRLIEAFELSQTLAALHYALDAYIKSEWIWLVPWYLKMVLRRMT